MGTYIMTFLMLNNFTVSVRDGSVRRSDEEGSYNKSFSGEHRDSRQWVRRRWDIETQPLGVSDADALELWILGHAHHWSFDYDLYSEQKGKGPNSGYNIVNESFVGFPKFSDPKNQYIQVGNGTAGRTITFSIPQLRDSDYTISRWVLNITDAGFANHRHYVDRYDSGVVTSKLDNAAMPAISNYSISQGNSLISFTQLGRNNANTADASIWLEDLVIFPYAITDAMITAIFTSTNAFFSPTMRMTGDIVDEPGPVYVRGHINEIRSVQGRRAGVSGWENNLRVISFSLVEDMLHRFAGVL
jgi:hypothetical protein